MKKKKRVKKKKAKPSLSASLKAEGYKERNKRKESLWKGPEDDGPQGGVTQSLLGRFVVCRERFRLKVVEGLGTVEGFSKNLEYGQMFHLCAEYHAKGDKWETPLLTYVKSLCRKYPHDQEQIVHWYEVCKIQFPMYVAFWKKHSGKKKRTDLLQEVSFKVPYELPSGRVVFLRGKWDEVFLEGKGIWLGEHKTKGQIEEEQIRRQLNFDLQTMIYLVALKEYQHDDDCIPHDAPIKGVLYNVVRRPLSGGKGTIKRHKEKQYKNRFGEVTRVIPEETTEHYYGRVREVIDAAPETYFMRWYSEVSQEDIDRFKTEFLNPCLEQLCDWWECVDSRPGPLWSRSRHVHYRLPYGIYNVLAEGGSTEMDEYLATGSKVGLGVTDTLFPELA